MLNKMLDEIKKNYELIPVDTSEYAGIKAMGMKFKISAYNAKDLGNVSLMTAKGFFGLMQMDTLIINPFEKDAPLFSYDRIYAMGNDTLFLEMYETRLNKTALTEVKCVIDANKGLPDSPVAPNWYDDIKFDESVKKKGKKSLTPAFDKMTEEYLSAYLSETKKAGECDKDLKKKEASKYTEGLLTHGGPSTNVFVKAIGIEKTGRLFREILFGTGEV